MGVARSLGRLGLSVSLVVPPVSDVPSQLSKATCHVEMLESPDALPVRGSGLAQAAQTTVVQYLDRSCALGFAAVSATLTTQKDLMQRLQPPEQPVSRV